ncbi:hypothetical protein PINS_up014121 [Pythium insidiosum]|nr:hypothetical protein PINS_up014121 [Pythium insidiosum]
MATPATVAALEAKYQTLTVLKHKALAPLLMKLRDQTTPHVQFKHYADRLMRYVRCTHVSQPVEGHSNAWI